jgi:O-acetyl-ADP-ribose deacetylase (regulator of RNase III)
VIEPTYGDLLQADAEALVNAVNCHGLMGKGIALQFKLAFPNNYQQYKAACDAGAVQPGHMLVAPTGQRANPRYIINFPTKRHWRDRSRLDDVESGLAALIEVVRDLKIGSIAIPALGCGLGGLDWATVRPLIVGAFVPLPEVRVLLYEPEVRVLLYEPEGARGPVTNAASPGAPAP